MPVEPTRSAKSTVTTRRSSAITARPWSGPAVAARWTLSICSRGTHTRRREGNAEATALAHSAPQSVDGDGDPDRGGASLQVARPGEASERAQAFFIARLRAVLGGVGICQFLRVRI